MDFEWTAHRFSGGVLVLDLINTVVHRLKPGMRIDRLADPSLLPGFIAGASRFRADETAGSGPVETCGTDELSRLVALREAANTVFRTGGGARAELHRLFAAVTDASKPDAALQERRSFAFDCAMSAIRLLGSAQMRRVRACPVCDWLFLDKSRNGSRRWCDMAICGNRTKASLHYKRQRSRGVEMT